MSDPSLALQGAIFAALSASQELAAIVGERIFDQPPSTYAGPYVTIGEDQVLPDFADCIDGSETFSTIHAWAKDPGFPTVKRIVAAIRGCLHNAPLTLPGFNLVVIEFYGARYLRDPDGTTTHAVLTFRALCEAA